MREFQASSKRRRCQSSMNGRVNGQAFLGKLPIAGNSSKFPLFSRKSTQTQKACSIRQVTYTSNYKIGVILFGAFKHALNTGGTSEKRKQIIVSTKTLHITKRTDRNLFKARLV